MNEPRSAHLPDTVRHLIESGATFVVNHSGGKDSQAMYLLLRQHVPAAQIIIVHADLGAVEWAGAVEHIEATTAGEPLHVCRAKRDFLTMVDDRGMFPSPKYRQCTSDLKRGPIEKVIRGLGVKLIVNCMGMRAEESPKRAKLATLKLSKRNSKAGRTWYEWLPIHDWTEQEVFGAIVAAGQQPHIVYSLGMSRFSCVFCIMASKADLATAARLATQRPELLNDPHLYRKITFLERKTGQVMIMPTKKEGRRSLEEITGVAAHMEAA